MNIIILSFLNAIIFAFYCLLVCYFVLEKKPLSFNKVIKASIPFFMMYYCILCFMDSIYSMFFSGVLAFIFIKIIYEESIFMSMFISLIIHSLKIVIKICVLLIINNPNLLLVNTYKTLDWDAFYINLITLVSATIIVFLLRKVFRRVLIYVTSLRNRKIILLVAVYFNFFVILIFQPLDNFCSIETITDFIMIFTVVHVGVFNISSEMKMETLVNYYKEVFEYSKANGELLTHYKMQVHENKNRLLMIKGMLDGPKKDVKVYIDSLLEEIKNNKCNCNYWLAELKYINLPGIRNFINYKLIKLTNLGAKVELFISSEIEKFTYASLSEKEYNQLTTILGVILDNMIDSVAQIKDDKLVSINIYIEDNKIHCEFVNNFSGEIDLTRLNEVGYSTKGDQHGVGLPLVAKIVKSSNRFECEPTIMDNFFIQHLIIKLDNKDELPKKVKK